MNNEFNNEMYRMIMPSIKNRSVKEVPKENKFNFRIKMAEYQKGLDSVDKDTIIKYVNEFLKGMGMKPITNPHVKPKDRDSRQIEYYKVCKSHAVENGIEVFNKEDIVWIKFTVFEDKTEPYISVIGTSCDIRFNDYAKNNTAAGIINQVLDGSWDTKDVLIFPLFEMPEGLNRSDIESGIGNYLISKGVPILDYYSHNY